MTMSLRAYAGALALCLGALLQLCYADTLDIDVKMYQDSNCFERRDDLLILDDTCYANLFTNLTKAYKMKIVGFDPASQQLDLFDYTDDCQTLFTPKRTLSAGKCERFIAGYFGIINIRLRASTCEGPDCSRLAVTNQRFYSEEGCQGLPYQIYTYPVQNECMRWANGTQVFTVDPTNTKITQVDYLANDKCDGGMQKRYEMENGLCYPLYTDRAPRSFLW
eukprot:CAMPEP_0197663208 /NCGR_PEP_ID=MMETSP1338-20131121/56523_1 /TAXON_ID=43686 ORGANISM="Pelagodinium beii, Strain RCC1491" /NCGR_SAMPLE_ID=MMETSP1338 /ASSEMBLY_ACC=CAM_ASM_000754 /LENGTH=220 /DNA_ID=CAMNT_0043241461 /DNA_START=44 /DNA_END=703 /DNA_ORIENTATION=-